MAEIIAKWLRPRICIHASLTAVLAIGVIRIIQLQSRAIAAVNDGRYGHPRIRVPGIVELPKLSCRR